MNVATITRSTDCASPKMQGLLAVAGQALGLDRAMKSSQEELAYRAETLYKNSVSEL